MKRRGYLKSAGSIAIFPIDSFFLQQKTSDQLDTIAREFFDALPDSETERSEAVTDCANALCTAQRAVSKEVIDLVREGGATVDDFIRHLRFGIRTLNEFNITTAVDETTLERSQRATSKLTQYLPLLGSFNNLCDAACKVETPNPDADQVQKFLFAAIAFGIEIGLWSVGAPFNIAFKGTRFVANRTFLRFTRHGCRGCVALAMSEIHWAIRGTIYSDGVTQSNVQFVYKQITELQSESRKIDYDVDLDYTHEEIRNIVEQGEGGGGALLGPVESEGPLEGLLDFDFSFDFNITLPELPSLSDRL